MNKKRMFLLALSLSIILGIGIASGAIIATQQSADNKTNIQKSRKNYSNIHEKSNKKRTQVQILLTKKRILINYLKKHN
ncbi:hypothetical protein ACWN56_07855 [Weissella viridescens]